MLMATRPNIMPICLTTGIGPSGPETIFVQQPDGEPDPASDPHRGDSPIDNQKSLQVLLPELQACGYTADSAPLPAQTTASASTTKTFSRAGSKSAGVKKAKTAPKMLAGNSCAPKPSVLTRTPHASCESQKKTFDQLLSDNIEYAPYFLQNMQSVDAFLVMLQL